MLVLAPTRELAQQIAAVLEEAGSRAGLRTLCAYGGVPKNPQAVALRRGVDVLVATPGRLEDLMQDGACRCRPVCLMGLRPRVTVYWWRFPRRVKWWWIHMRGP